MCGRYTLHSTARRIANAFKLAIDPTFFMPRYNIAPSQPILAVRQRDGRREAAMLRWGLVPSWADDPAIGNRMINAKAETVADKPAFREAFNARRCLIPADGFYEWAKIDARHKQPMLIRRRDGEPMALAGLWERWVSDGEDALETCVIITTEPNAVMRPIHDRMPAIIETADVDDWLDPATPRATLERLLMPLADDRLEAHPVSTRVNSPAFDDAACIEIESAGDNDRGLFGS
ncbi:MAG: SOS response-associated peptidase [Planctomycetes bacterium]|nr:SOS response-associated peptidase [Planctomycetota bacterium]